MTRFALAAVFTCAQLGAASGAALALSRPHDPVIVPVARLDGLRGRTTRGLRLVRFSAGRVEPLPFQLDARGDDGEIDVDALDPFTLDANDELVFMARDAGERGPLEALPAADAWEIEIVDPSGAAPAWVYLLAARDAADTAALPAPSSQAYVHFDADSGRARSAAYEVEYARARNSFAGMRIPAGGGGNGANLLRRTRMRGEPTFSLGFAQLRLSFTERDTIIRLEGVRNGPVRAVRRVALAVDLGPLFPELPNGSVQTLHYATSFVTPTRMSVPYLALELLADFRFENFLEFAAEALPLAYWDGANPEGASFSGPARPLEKERDHSWFVVSGTAGTFLQTFAVPQEWLDWGVARGTVFRPAATNGSSRRAHAAGFSLLNMTKIRRHGVYAMRQATVVLPQPYRRGDETAALAMLEAPLFARARRLR